MIVVPMIGFVPKKWNFPVVWIVGGPFLLAQLFCDLVVRIGLHFDSLPSDLFGPLAFRLATVTLIFVSWDK